MSSVAPGPAFVLLDLDGTLVRMGWDDPALRPGRQRLRQIVAELGLDPPFGQLVPALAEAGRRLPWVAEALDDFERSVAERSVACAGLGELVAALRGVPSALVTNNGRPAALAALARVGLRPEDFGAVIGREDVTRFKPDPEPLRRAVAALRERHGEPGRVLMVGDAPTDLEAAAALGPELPCGVLGVAILGGIGREADLRAAGAHAVLASLAELPALL